MRPDLSSEKPFEYDGDICRRIPLTQGQWAIVLAIHFEWLMQWRWYAAWADGTSSFYAVRKQWVNGKRMVIGMHRFILGLPPGRVEEGDHKNNNTLDCRLSNLRPADDEGSARNHRKNKNNTSGYKGVDWSEWKQMWRARIGFKGQRILLGYFNTKEEAYAAYCKAAKELYGEFARVA